MPLACSIIQFKRLERSHIWQVRKTFHSDSVAKRQLQRGKQIKKRGRHINATYSNTLRLELGWCADKANGELRIHGDPM